MEPAGAERHRRSPEGVSERERANQSNRLMNEIPVNDQTARKIKAGAGIEPANRGFADPDLTTWLPRRLFANGRLGAPNHCVNVAAIRNSALDVGRWALDVSPFRMPRSRSS